MAAFSAADNLAQGQYNLFDLINAYADMSPADRAAPRGMRIKNRIDELTREEEERKRQDEIAEQRSHSQEEKAEQRRYDFKITFKFAVISALFAIPVGFIVWLLIYHYLK